MSTLQDQLRAQWPHDDGRDVREAAAQRITALEAEIAALQVDAERYRWLRDGCCDKGTPASNIAQHKYGMEWDAAIDAARGKT